MKQPERLFVTRDGMFLCPTHFVSAFLVMHPPYQSLPRDELGDGRELDADEMQAFHHCGLNVTCGMCGQIPSPGRTCHRCDTPLHEEWPAVYCSNECALADS